MTQKPPESSGLSRLEAARMGYDDVMRSLEHEDSKANRILVAMAFITTASSIVFVYLHALPSGWTIGISQTSWVALFFGIYVGLVLIGTLCMLAALGPRHHIPAEWGTSSGCLPKSRLFFQKIAEVTREEWQNHMQTTDLEQLEKLIENDLIYETHLLSQKNRYKVQMMAVGKELYRWSFIPLMAFVTFGLAGNSILAFGLFVLFFAVALVHKGIEDGLAPERLAGSGPLSWVLIARSLYQGRPAVKVKLAIGVLLFVLSVILIILSA